MGQKGRGMKTAISSYSFHRFGQGPEGDARPTFSEMIEACVRLGIDGLELLGVHFESAEPGALHSLRQLAFRRGIALISVSAHHNFVPPDPDRRREEAGKLCRCVDLAD